MQYIPMSTIVNVFFWKYFTLVLLVGVLTVIFEQYNSADFIGSVYRKKSLGEFMQLDPGGSRSNASGVWHKVTKKLYIYSAYYDDRGVPGSHKFGHVRIMGFEEATYNTTTYCCFSYGKNNMGWSPPSGQQLAKRTVFRSYNATKLPEQLYFNPVMYSCRLNDSRVPTSVFLTTEQHCFAKDIHGKLITVTTEKSLLVNHNTEQGFVKDFAVCVHSPLFNMNDHVLVAGFIELNRILGAELFTFYIYSASDSVRRLLRSYQIEGSHLVDVVSRWGENMPKARYYGQDLSIHDCLLRNMNKARYLFFVDLDEVVLPHRHRTWTEMVQYLDNDESVSAFRFPHVAMFRDDMHSNAVEHWAQKLASNLTGCSNTHIHRLGVLRYLSYTLRSRRLSLNKGKLLVKPRDIRSLVIHSVSEFWKSGKRMVTVDPDVASLLHYRLNGLDKFRKRTASFDQLRNIALKLFLNVEKRLCQLNL